MTFASMGVATKSLSVNRPGAGLERKDTPPGEWWCRANPSPQECRVSYNTLWHVPNHLWLLIEHLLPPDKPKGTVGRPALRNRQVLDGILYVLRTGCQWKSLDKDWFGASSSL